MKVAITFTVNVTDEQRIGLSLMAGSDREPYPRECMRQDLTELASQYITENLVKAGRTYARAEIERLQELAGETEISG